MLSAQVYCQNKLTAEYVRQKGIDEIRYPEMIIEYTKKMATGSQEAKQHFSRLMRIRRTVC